MKIECLFFIFIVSFLFVLVSNGIFRAKNVNFPLETSKITWKTLNDFKNIDLLLKTVIEIFYSNNHKANVDFLATEPDDRIKLDELVNR